MSRVISSISKGTASIARCGTLEAGSGSESEIPKCTVFLISLVSLSFVDLVNIEMQRKLEIKRD